MGVAPKRTKMVANPEPLEPKPAFPGQKKRLYFDMEQLEALASPIRAEVFWSFTKDQPQSVSEVAKALGKSAQTVHYHVNALVEVGLLISVAERKSRARMEKLYVHSASQLFTKPDAPFEEHGPMIRGFKAITRSMAREYETMWRAIERNPDFGSCRLIRRISVRMSEERAVRVKNLLKELADELMVSASDPEGSRVNVYMFMAPTLGESRRLLETRNGGKAKS